jgi:DNA-binding CsgD family transcriptional regulator
MTGGVSRRSSRRPPILIITKGCSLAQVVPYDDEKVHDRSVQTVLLGREEATSTIDVVLDAVGQSGEVILVRGEVGIGKTAILRAARSAGERREMVILSAAGVPSETHVPFAGLSQLIGPIIGSDDSNQPQYQSLRAALGSSTPVGPELFRIALETLDLLTARAAHSPVLLIVDDVHWLDQETTNILAFLGRRISNDPIVLVAARRGEWTTALDGLDFREIALERLDDQAARALLEKRAPQLAPWVRERIIAAAAGNALALTELPTAFDGEEVDPLAPLPLNERLQQAFGERVRQLSPRTRSVLVLCALNDQTSLAEVLSAARLADGDIDIDDVVPAVEAGLVELDMHEIRFRHPLMRDAVALASSLSDRRAGHRLLAEALASEPDRAIWHRAASTLGPNAEVAAELEEAATRSRRRGALETSSGALERAAQISDNGQDRNRRLLEAAVLAVELGRTDTAARLVDQITLVDLSPIDSARRLLVAETIRPSLPDDDNVAGSLVEAAERMLAQGENELALELLWLAANSCFWADRGPRSGERIVQALTRFNVPPDDPRGLSITAYAAPIRRGGRVIDHIAEMTCDPVSESRLNGLIANAAVTLGALDLAIPFMDAAVDGLRRDGRLGHLAQALILRGWASAQLGRREIAEADGAESVRLAGETHQPIWEGAGHVIEAMTLGYRGEVEEAFVILTKAEGIGIAVGGRALLNVVQIARGAIALSNGSARMAFDSLFRLFDPMDPSYHSVESCWAIGLLADAALVTGRQADVRALVQDLGPIAEQLNSPWFQVSIRHARAVLAESSNAERAFEAAFVADLSRWPLDWARLHLAYGKWLRRQKRLTEARASLRTARDGFDAIGAVAWGQRAREELQSAGETSGPRVPHVSERLTPQELQIARHAAEGMTNRDIADRLYLSPRTVGSHLYRIFPKLGITERTQLAVALRQTAQAEE